jgi:two-component system LytT family sensor kinase
VSIDPLSLDAMVPTMILQPLVENAVKHGVASRAAPGRVEIRSELRDGRLRLEVCDNGPGPDEGSTYLPTKGLGIANTRARLDQLYGASHQFSFRKPAAGGTIVIMDIPARMKCNTAAEVHRESHEDYEESVDAHSHDYRG